MTARKNPAPVAAPIPGLSLTGGRPTAAKKNPAAPVAEVIGRWAAEYVRLTAGDPSAVESIAAWLTMAAPAMVADELRRMAENLSAVAASLTAEDVKVVADHDGHAASLKVTVGAEETANAGAWAQTNVKVTVDPASDLGKALRALGVSPRLAKPASAATTA